MKAAFPLLLTVMLAAQASPALAQSYEAALMAQLQREGYARISMTTTLLGRIRIQAEGQKGQREIVLNPRTGEVLRDVWHVADKGDDDGGEKDRDDRSDRDDSRAKDDRRDDKPDDSRDVRSDKDDSGGDDSGGGSDSRGGDDD